MRKGTLAAGATMLLAAAAAGQVWVTEPASGGPVERGDEALRAAMLAGHNEARAAAGVAPLTWDPRLAQDAAGYAADLVATDRFEHSIGRRGSERQGENLWAGTPLAYSFDEMMGHWLAERADFRPGVLPNVSRTGRFEDVAHYVQIVWPRTTRFGCAVAANDHAEYLVCRYAPPGSVAGRRLD